MSDFLSVYLIWAVQANYAGKSFTIYSGRKSTNVKVTEGELDSQGRFTFEVPDGKNYTLIVED